MRPHGFRAGWPRSGRLWAALISSAARSWSASIEFMPSIVAPGLPPGPMGVNAHLGFAAHSACPPATAWRAGRVSAVSLTSQVQTAGGSLAGNEHSPISSTVDPQLLRCAVERRSSRGEQRSHGRQPGGRDLHQGPLRSSGSVCSDEPAHGQASARARYLGWTTIRAARRARRCPRRGGGRVEAARSHLGGGVVTALEHAGAPGRVPRPPRTIGASSRVGRGSCACSGAVMLFGRLCGGRAWWG